MEVMKNNFIFIRGVGVIGWPLTALFLSLKDLLPNTIIAIEPYQLTKENIYHIEYLCDRGAVFVKSALNDSGNFSSQFNTIPFEEARNLCDIVLDCSPPSIAEKRLSEYGSNLYKNCKGFIAQGSEHKFGKQLLFPDNTSILNSNMDRFYHISTCNTHTLSAIIRIFENLSVAMESIDFVIIRRDADMAKNDPHVTGPLFQIPESENGTHHSRLLNELYQTVQKQYPVTSSAMTVNSPYMHITRFRIEVDRIMKKEQILAEIEKDPLLSITNLISSNMIFSSGRERGDYGRIFSHAVFVEPSLEVNGRVIRGLAATPGDSNVLISTIYAALKVLEVENLDLILQALYQKVIQRV
ncbi:MAG TPA: hypothetical protein PK079_09035 [Leptospiraceae bacterium]|nr:hypothetical protein [Leptospiraceae bacterium]HMW06872.1 hypothetical protein [Leptospiraceae bacterium]HMX35296.1 hypothetical protein [Leptospiraceae bacterium]HMY32391.1 hypothetical protein [Leptospiraceae bacterium]HMZ65313.1 hypothetical protein [Leptospiraceae bacterium]